MKKLSSPMPLCSGFSPLHWWIVSLGLWFFVNVPAVLRAQPATLLTGSRELKAGDKGFIAWRFQGYESVQIVGDTLRAIRGARDMITVSPAKTTTYRLTALKQSGGRLDTVWRVIVLTQAQSDSIATNEARSTGGQGVAGANNNSSARESMAGKRLESKLPASIFATTEAHTTPSRYYAGLKRAEEGVVYQPVILKIVRIPDNSIEGAYLHAIILDSLGNFLPTFHDLHDAFKLTLTGKRDTNRSQAHKDELLPPTSPTIAVREASLYDSPDVAITLCTDNAGYMRKFASASTREYNDFMRSLGDRVEKNRIVFDHRIVVNAAAAPEAESGGLTALYKAAYKGILTLKQSGRRHRALVLVSGGKDDASLLYTMHDVMRSAREYGVVVYAIAMGSNADTYALRMMADYTGGRFYAVSDEKPDELGRVLKEIALSYKAFYELTLSGGTSVQAHATVIDATLSFSTDDHNHRTALNETVPFAMNEQAYYSAHQIVATFAANSFQADDEQYGQHIASLAQALKDNPTKVIELIGHTDMQGNDGNNRSFALRRAQAVKSRLMTMGAHPAQIRLRSAGREKPVYYFESEEWQSRVNRRVELRWLDPALVPYEILAEAVASEEEAMRLEAQWNARGFDVYYDAFLINRVPAYRLKLWGFPTLESAMKTKEALQLKYNVAFRVQ